MYCDDGFVVLPPQEVKIIANKDANTTVIKFFIFLISFIFFKKISHVYIITIFTLRTKKSAGQLVYSHFEVFGVT